jgi:predicted nucleotidyltransferase component of viral defense system
MLHLDAVPKPVATLLDQLASRDCLQHFALGGGTSLALRFGHRLSVDLDYFTPEEFQPQTLWDSLNFDGSTLISMSKNTLCLVSQGVKIDLLRHAYDTLAPIETIGSHRLISLPDLAAMKLNAITNRGSKKGFFDLAELLQHFSLDDMLRFFSQKYRNTDPFALIRSLAWFEDAEQEPDPVPRKGQSWENIKIQIIQTVRSL